MWDLLSDLTWILTDEVRWNVSIIIQYKYKITSKTATYLESWFMWRLVLYLPFEILKNINKYDLLFKGVVKTTKMLNCQRN